MIATKIKQWQLVCFFVLSAVTVFFDWLLILNYAYFQSLNGQNYPQLKSWFRFFETDQILHDKFVYVLSLAIFFTTFTLFLSAILTNRLLIKGARRRATNEFLISSTQLPDDLALTIFNLHGLNIDGKKVTIDMTFLNYASPDALAQALSFLLHLQSQKHLNDWTNGEANVFHDLATILLEYCDPPAINELIEAMAVRKLYLAKFLQGAIRRVELEKELSDVSEELKQNISAECNIITDMREEVESILPISSEPSIGVLRCLTTFLGLGKLSDGRIRNLFRMAILSVGHNNRLSETDECLEALETKSE